VGGEALLRPDLVVAMGEMARAHGIEDVMVAGSNCSWATTDERARELLLSVRNAGIGIGFSMDAFHQEHIPLERVERACRAARELGLQKADRPSASVSVIESMDADNAYDRETRKLAATFEQRGFQVALDRAGMMFCGRATALCDLRSGERSVPRDICQGAPWVCGDFRHPPSIQIDADGWVMLEHGISIGNTRDRSLSEVLDRYDPSRHPIISVLLESGPLGLTRLPEAEAFELRPEGYINKCHLCCEIRNHLRRWYADTLAPECCYPSDGSQRGEVRMVARRREEKA